MLYDGNTVKDSGRFLKEDIKKLVIIFAVPSIFSMLVSEIYNMVNYLYVGQIIGAKGLAALTVAFPVQDLFMALSFFIAIGTSTSISRFLGEKDTSKIKKIIPNSIALLISTFLVLIVGILIFRNDLIMKLGSSERIFPLAKTYIIIILFGVIFKGLTVLMSYILNSFGNTKVILVSTAIGAVFNIILGYVFLVIFNLGIAGAAAATVISQTIAFIYIFNKFMKLKKDMNLTFQLNLNKSICKEILVIGFSTFIVEISDSIVAVVLNKILLQLGGDSAIVAVGIINRVTMCLFITIIGISSAMQPILGYNYGAGKTDRVKEIVKLSTKLVTISSIILWTFTMIFARAIIGFFVKDIEIIDYTVKAFRIAVSIFPTIGLYYVAIYYYQAMGEAKLSFILSIFRQIMAFIPLIYIMVYGFGLGVVGAWMAYPVSDILSLGISIIYIKYYKVEDMMEEYDKVKKKKKAVTAYEI